MKIAIFGGTGSIGTVIAEVMLEEKDNTLILVSNNEQELWESRNHFDNNERIKWVFCDIRDSKEVSKLFGYVKIDIVFNCAALKHLGFCEQFPVNAIKTNILGLENLLYHANRGLVSKFIQISTDKAVEPTSVMGASKLIGERLCREWNRLFFKVSCVRFGNVWKSRGSLYHKVKHDLEMKEEVYLTDNKMRRYFIDKEGVGKFIKRVLVDMVGGEIFIPKLVESRIIDVIHANFGSDVNIKEVGRHPNEKLHEKLFSEYEQVEECEKYWKINQKS